MSDGNTRYIWATLRILMGWLFFWSFPDKLFGLGFATQPESAWIRGGSPTAGFLGFGTAGPLAPIYEAGYSMAELGVQPSRADRLRRPARMPIGIL
jgi:hypothetical protein